MKLEMKDRKLHDSSITLLASEWRSEIIKCSEWKIAICM